MGNKEELEKERDYHKDREIRATARIEELKKKLEIEVHKLGRRYLIESIEQYATKIQIPKYEAMFEGHLKAVFSNDMLWDWRTAIPKEEKEQLFVSVRIMEGRKEVTKNPEAYSSSIREMLRFVRNIIVH